MKEFSILIAILMFAGSSFSIPQETNKRSSIATPLSAPVPVTPRSISTMLTTMVFNNQIDQEFLRTFQVELRKAHPDFPKPGVQNVPSERTAYEQVLREWLLAHPDFVSKIK